LKIRPERADLVKEHRAALSQLELAKLSCLSAGKGALLVAKELRIDQVSGKAATLNATKGRADRGL
jgi:hypothetical protein